jgi:hypothetical protein
MTDRSLPIDSPLPVSDAPDSLLDVLAPALLNLVTSGAIIVGGFFCFFCSF